MFIDTHSHFNMVLKRFKLDEKTAIRNLQANKVGHAVQVAISAETSAWSYDFAKRNAAHGIFFTLGIQPSSVAGKNELDSFSDLLSRAVKEDPELLFGIGECGLDYYRMRQDKHTQIRSFIYQINKAQEYDLPLIIHVRDAMSDLIEILKSRAPVWGIMHCFAGNKNDAQKLMDLNFYISFAGNVTYKNAHILHDTASYVPLDRILLETDAPFLTPVPLRGKKNRPEYVIHTYEYIARLKKISIETLQEKVYENFKSIAKF